MWHFVFPLPVDVVILLIAGTYFTPLDSILSILKEVGKCITMTSARPLPQAAFICGKLLRHTGWRTLRFRNCCGGSFRLRKSKKSLQLLTKSCHKASDTPGRVITALVSSIILLHWRAKFKRHTSDTTSTSCYLWNTRFRWLFLQSAFVLQNCKGHKIMPNSKTVTLPAAPPAPTYP